MSKKFNKDIGILGGFLLFSPLFSLPFIWNKIINRKEYATHFLAFFMGMTAMLYPPFADLYRHTMNYFSSQEEGNFLLQVTIARDFFLPGISYFFAKYGIHFEWVRFLFVFFSYEIFFSIFKYYASKNEFIGSSRTLYCRAFLITFFLLPFFHLAGNLRQGMANYVMMWACFLIFERNKQWAWILTLLGPCIHFSVLVITALMFVSKWIKPGKKVALLGMFVFLFLGYYFRNHSVGMIGNEQVDKNINFYINQSVENFDDTASLKGWIAYYLELLPMVGLLIYVWKSRDMPGYVYNFLILNALCFPFFQLFGRMAQFTMPIVFFLFVKNYRNSPFDKRILKIIYISAWIAFFALVYGRRETFLYGRFYKLIYPAPLVLDNQYDQEWMMKNNTATGEFK